MPALTVCAVPAGATSLLAVGERIADAPAHVLERLGLRPDPLMPGRLLPAESTVRRLLAHIDADALDGAVGRWLADRPVALAAQRVLESGVVVGVVALGPGLGGVVAQALPLGQGVGRGGEGGLVPGVGVPIRVALLDPGLFQGLLEVLPGHPGRPATDPAADAAEQPVLLVVGLVLGEGGAGGVPGEGGVQRRAGRPRLGVDDGLRQGARLGAVDDPHPPPGPPSRPGRRRPSRSGRGPGRRPGGGCGCRRDRSGAARSHRAPAGSRASGPAQAPVGGRGTAAAWGRLQPIRCGVEAGGIGHRALPPGSGAGWRRPARVGRDGRSADAGRGRVSR
ncbi:transposase family protein [Kitasatospora sp. NPDC058965]|uniref:transposase family protein n=1 Tax=Kitasatospora sp. NPDC058965 TaxID=3346682 RepID=UPI0036B93054